MYTISTRPFPVPILKAIRAGVGFGSGTETKHASSPQPTLACLFPAAIPTKKKQYKKEQEQVTKKHFLNEKKRM